MKNYLIVVLISTSLHGFADGIEEDPCGYVDVEISAGIKAEDFHCKNIKDKKKRQHCKYVYATAELHRFGVQKECKIVKGKNDWIFVRDKFRKKKKKKHSPGKK